MPDYSINILWEPVEIPGVQIPCCHVEGWRGFYAISCDGRIWTSFDQIARAWNCGWRERRPQPIRSGHLLIQLCANGRKEFYSLHCLVLEAFRGRRPGPHMECRHLDGHPNNNWWWNLKWGTRQENVDDKELHGNLLEGESHPESVLTERIVIEARLRCAAGESLEVVADSLGHNRGTIHSAVRGQSWQCVTDPPPLLQYHQMSREKILRIATMIREGRLKTQEIADACNVGRGAVYCLRRRMKRNPQRYLE